MYVSAQLADEHNVEQFTCAKASLDRWLSIESKRAQRQGTARTTVWTAPKSPDVVAYYSIAPTQVGRAELSRKMSGGISVVPGYLLARLALDVALHGDGLGRELLVDALETICAAAETAGGRIIVVDPIDDQARSFYEHYEFRPGPLEGRLYMLIDDARISLLGN